ncbi:BTAD domain-containing putative transcriptional regulator [Geodermatophilus sp. SYSU D00691]
MFRVLGPLEVEVGSERLVIQGARGRGLLVALLLQRDAVVPSGRLVELLWDEPPEDPANALAQVVRRLRAQLGAAADRLRTRPPGYVLRAAPEELDAERFERALREARALRQVDPFTALHLLDEALDLWRGPAFGEFADTFARAPAARLEELRLVAREERALLLLDVGSVAEAVAAAGELVAVHPFRPGAVEGLVRALAADGRAAEALEAYRRHRESLADELGIDPAPVLQELQGQVLRGALPTPRRPVRGPQAARVRPIPRLPWRPGPLLGREEDLRLLLGCLRGRRLLSLVGPGGVGKTRLALEASHALADGGGRVWWADLSATAGGRLVDVVAEALGADLPIGADRLTALEAAAVELRGLLVLDNAETVLAPLAELAERLLAAAPALTLLATSRERLDAAGEHVHVLAPLPVPAGAGRDNPAVRLFLDRAPGLEVDHVSDAEVDLVAATCRRLDGLPLAIELGAARAPSFGLAEFASRLDRGLDLLAGGRRTSPSRHRSLRAVIDWSYRLLAEEEARLFRRLAVFPAAFTPDRAEAVCGDEVLPAAAVAPVLARLCEQSLVQFGDGRFWLLQTLRDFARDQWAADEGHSLRARHAADTAGRAATWRRLLWTAREPAAVAALAALTDDLHAAWAFAREHDRPLAVRLAADLHDHAYWRQRLDLLAWGLVVAEWDDDLPRTGDALAAAASAAWAAGRLDQAETLARRGVAAAGAPDAPAAAAAVEKLADLAMFTGRTAESVTLYRRAGELWRRAGEPLIRLMCEIAVCQVLAYGGRDDEALARLAELRATTRASEVPTVLGWWHYVRGEALAAADPAGALAEYGAAITHAGAADNRLVVMIARSAAVTTLAGARSPSAAFEEFGRVLDSWDDLGNEALQWWVLLHLAVRLVDAGRDRDAALIAGAVLAHQDHHPVVVRDRSRLDGAVDALLERGGNREVDALLAQGARLSISAALAVGRAAIEAVVRDPVGDPAGRSDVVRNRPLGAVDHP